MRLTTSHCLTKEPAFPPPKKTRVQRAVGNQAHGREEGEEGVVTRKNEPRGGGGGGKLNKGIIRHIRDKIKNSSVDATCRSCNVSDRRG